MIFKKIAAAVLVIAVLLSTGCSKESSASESSSESSSTEIIVTPVEPSVSSSTDTSETSGASEESSSMTSSASEHSESENSVTSSVSSMPEYTSSHAEEVPKKDYGTLILVNPHNYIPEDYLYQGEKVQGKYDMDIKAAGSAKKLLEAAKEAGFDMRLCSAFRTVEKSAELYRNKVYQYMGYGYSEADAKIEAAKWVAPPGTSEHHTGLAMDLVSSDYWNYYSDLEHDYEKFDSFKWLYEHCAEFGFILRYPKDKQDITGITYEPWHYRYVGVEAAKYIMENGLCLEEYLEIIK